MHPIKRLGTILAVSALATGTLAACSSAATQAPYQDPTTDHGRSSPRPYVERGAPTTAPATMAPVTGAEPRGGAAEPVRDRGPAPVTATRDGVTFEDAGVNPYVDANRDRESTFALDVDTASYTVARTYIADGSLPDRASVRVEEWVNWFDQAYPVPESSDFAVYADGGPAPFLTGVRDAGEVLLRVGIRARDVTRRERPNAALTFVIDTSGSMGRDDRLELVKRSLGMLVDQLRRDDSVSIVAFSTEARVVLEPTPGSDRETILRAIDRLQPQNTTNAEAGLKLGYGLAHEALIEGGINRVILASDGVANVGNTDSESILRAVRDDAEAGIQLVSVGVGMGNFNDALLEQLADQGDGFYAYVDTQDEAHRLFVEELVSTLDTVALDAKAQVEFDPAVVAAYRLIGYENRDVADGDFRNNRVDAGAIGAGHSVTALYGLRLRDGIRSDDRVATVNLRWTNPATGRVTEIAHDVNGVDLATSFERTDPHFKLDALVAAAAEVFRGSPWIEEFSVRDLADAAHEIRGDLPHTDQVDEFLRMLDDAARLED